MVLPIKMFYFPINILQTKFGYYFINVELFFYYPINCFTTHFTNYFIIKS